MIKISAVRSSTLRFQFSLQCAMLSRCQLEIKDHTIAIVEAYQFSDFLDFARAEQCTRVRAGQFLRYAVDTVNTSRYCQLRQLIKRFLNRPVSAGHIDADQDGTPGRSR